MFTLDLVLKVFITAFLGYITLNTFFRYHFSMDRITAIFLIALFVIMVFYRETTKVYSLLITIGIFVVFYTVLFLFSLKKKNFGYFLFNTYGKEYDTVLEDLTRLSQKLHIPLEHICYNKNRPFLVVFSNEDFKKVRKMMKDMDEIYTKKKKRFTMYNYWFLVAFLILAAAIWRF